MFVVGIACLKYTNKTYNDDLYFAGATLTVMGCVSVLIVLVLAIVIPPSLAYEEEKYNNLKEQLQYIEHDDIVTKENLRNQVLDMNNTISSHKIYSHNWWVGLWFSERIGSLEPLRWRNQKEDRKSEKSNHQ